MDRGIVKVIEVKKGRKFWRWHAKGWNGEIVFPSEQYDTRQAAWKTAEKVGAQLRVTVFEFPVKR